MRSIQQATLGLIVIVAGVPSNAAEYDEMAKETGACVDDAVNNVVYRSWLAQFRGKFAEKLNTGVGEELNAETSGQSKWAILSSTTNEKTGKTTDKYETEAKYVDRLRTLLTTKLGSEEAANAKLQEVANEIAATMPFSLDKAVRQGKIAQELLDAADGLLEKFASGTADPAAFVKKVTDLNPTYTFVLDDNGVPTRDSIALAIKANQERVAREAKADILG